MIQLYAPPEYWLLNDRQRADLCNGCGTKGLGGIIVPDRLYGLCISEACHIHDFMYAVGTAIEDKQEADRVFLNNMIRLIDAGTKWGWLKRLRSRRAYIYYQAVKCFGGPAFWRV